MISVPYLTACQPVTNIDLAKVGNKTPRFTDSVLKPCDQKTKTDLNVVEISITDATPKFEKADKYRYYSNSIGVKTGGSQIPVPRDHKSGSEKNELNFSGAPYFGDSSGHGYPVIKITITLPEGRIYFAPGNKAIMAANSDGEKMLCSGDSVLDVPNMSKTVTFYAVEKPTELTRPLDGKYTIAYYPGNGRPIAYDVIDPYVKNNG